MATRPQRCEPNISGEAFISQFVLFIDRRGPQLLSSGGALKLQPRCLEYLASRLSALLELLKVRASNPIEYFTGAVADLEDYKRLKKVQDFLEDTRYLKLHSAARGVRDPTPVILSPFRALTTLELRGCDLSSQCAIGMSQVCGSLEKLVCQDTLEALSHVLDPPLCQVDQAQHTSWPKLKQLSCMYNNISEMDTSLQLAPNIELLDLSRNNISMVANLEGCVSLTSLDLSHNNLSSIESALSSCCNLRRLILKGNAIRSLDGIEDLEQLQELDVRWNLIGSLKAVGKIAQLPEICKVGLEGNPVAMMPSYRIYALGCFPDVDRMELDEKTTTDMERFRAKRVAVSELRDQIIPPVDVSSRRSQSMKSIQSLWQLVTPPWLAMRSRRPSWTVSIDSASYPASPYDTESRRTPHKARRRVVDIPYPDDVSSVSQRSSVASPVETVLLQRQRSTPHSFFFQFERHRLGWMRTRWRFSELGAQDSDAGLTGSAVNATNGASPSLAAADL
ncbi:unnamed protein product [Ostreobium quekettii]|uniref:Uncharacterized protein n=1 Tax=Ostreobium quekettii TaxID=121088 RepID=A0A8S1J9H5_9CHLO|nr:unnamed protein product [Ostreobium quekettii]|eukprot:evm.model.scf_97.7 EVM.evm.TU.scf_97.7   scf_97:113864-115834(+)